MPAFSVITPVFNRAALLREMLASVAAQRFTDFEVIVVDDGSDDDPAGVVAGSGLNAKFLLQANGGPGAARNLGARHATGEYLAFLDSDDVWFPWTLSTYATVLEEARRPSFLAGKPIQFRDRAALAEVEEQPPAHRFFADYLASGDQWRWWGVSSFVIRREAMEACGGFSGERMNGEDADLALRLGTAPGFTQITEPVTFGYREHDANLTSSLERNLAGLWHKIRTERAGGYPGGEARAMERWRILTRHARPMILACLREGYKNEGWRMYRATFSWHVAMHRWRFLLGFPLQALLARSHAAPAREVTLLW